MTTLEKERPVATAPGADLRTAARVVFGLLVASQLAILVFTLWEPPFDGMIRYDAVAPVHGVYWPMNVLLGGPGYAIGTVTASVFLVVLGAGRGNVLALAGTVLHLLGGIVFALVITAEALPFAWAADPAVTPEAQGRDLFELWNANLDGFVPYILGSTALVALGALLAITGAVLSESLPRWVLAAAVAVVVALFVIPLGNSLGFVASSVEHALWLYIGWRGLRRVTSRA